MAFDTGRTAVAGAFFRTVAGAGLLVEGRRIARGWGVSNAASTGASTASSGALGAGTFVIAAATVAAAPGLGESSRLKTDGRANRTPARVTAKAVVAYLNPRLRFALEP